MNWLMTFFFESSVTQWCHQVICAGAPPAAGAAAAGLAASAGFAASVGFAGAAAAWVGAGAAVAAGAVVGGAAGALVGAAAAGLVGSTAADLLVSAGFCGAAVGPGEAWQAARIGPRAVPAASTNDRRVSLSNVISLPFR